MWTFHNCGDNMGNMLSKQICKIITLGIFLSLFAQNVLGDDRARFLQAEVALQRGNQGLYQKLKNELKNYPLYPYLLFSEYDRSLHSLDADTLFAFINQYPDTPLSDMLRVRWLQNKAKQEDWTSFLKAYGQSKDLNLQCYHLWARMQTQQNKNEVLEDVVPLWISGKEHPKACEAVFQVFERSHYLTRPFIWQRIKVAMQEGNLRIVRHMTQYIKSNERALVELWIMIHHNPYLITQSKYFNQNHPAILEMIVHGVSKIAKKQPETAIQIWAQIGRRYAFSERHWGAVVRSIGLSFAAQKNPEAERWLSKVPNVYANQAVHESRVRMALAKEDWQRVLFWLKNFPETLAKEEIWQYWHGRALASLNQGSAAQQIMEKLSQTRSFYGFLASQHMQKPYAIAQQKFPVDNTTLNDISKKESVRRARELHLLGREAKAREEWLMGAQFMSDKERHSAAALALKWGLPNWSILALSKAQNKNDLSLRFPIVHSDKINRAAKHTELDPAFIFAITRQESAFVTKAKSSAGALGLMQLMPDTARLVAKKHQVPLKNLNALMDPETNIKLGSRYLRMMLNTYENHPILATAAYNAGPGRIKKWLPPNPMSADTWIETIPFKETREYVKNVMTYTVIYRELLGNNQNKTFKLPHIPAEKRSLDG